MQTRRDQLQAYRFQNRRALAALVTGEPNVLEPPMRRLTVTTLSGIMIAILIAAGFAAVGIIHPSAGDDWKNSRAVIVDRDNNSTYVYLNDKLYPVLNYTSGVLAVSGRQSGGSGGEITRVQVSSGDISGATYGPEIGIPDVPSALPSAGSLLRFPMSVCSVQRLNQKSGATQATVTLRVDDSAAGSSPIRPSHGIVVQAPKSPEFLLTDGRRFQLSNSDIASKLGFDTPPVSVGTAFVNSIPLGGNLTAPAIGETGKSSYSVGGVERPLGTVVTVTDSDDSFIVLAKGLQRLNPVEAALFADSPSRLSVTSAAIESVQKVTQDVDNPITDLGRSLPSAIPTNDDTAGDRQGACVVYDSASATPQFSLAPDSASNGAPGATVGEGRASSVGNADKVEIPATMGVLATPANDPHTVVLISDQGRQYAFESRDLLASFGYSASDVVKMPAALLSLVPDSNIGLSTSAARRTAPR